MVFVTIVNLKVLPKVLVHKDIQSVTLCDLKGVCNIYHVNYMPSILKTRGLKDSGYSLLEKVTGQQQMMLYATASLSNN